MRANGWTGGQYSVYRVCLGAYLLVHFAQLIPWATEMFSSEGALGNRKDSPLIYLFPNILALWDSPLAVHVLLGAGAASSVLFAVGKRDRWAALGAWYVLACLFGRNPLIANPSLPYVGWLLLAHACLPRAPYGSWDARQRTDPGGGWRMPAAIFLLAWVLMALGYTYSGYTKLISPSWLDGTALQRVLENPLARAGWPRELLLGMPDPLLRLSTWGALSLELLFAPLVLFRRLRPWVWASMLVMHVNLMVVIDFIELSMGMVILHAFTFDPGWVGPRPARVSGMAQPAVPARIGGAPSVAGAAVAGVPRAVSASAAGAPPASTHGATVPVARGVARGSTTDWLFYDGSCGLCHRAVRFVLAEDRAGDTFRFAPLGGERFTTDVPDAERRALPDSLVVYTTDGRLLTRAAGVLYLLARLGGFWRVAAILGGVIPTAASDAVYDFVAGIRHTLFEKPKEACPLLPAHLRHRFEL